MMDMNALILGCDLAIAGQGRVEDPPDLVVFVEQLRRALLQVDQPGRARLYELLSSILKQ